MSLDFDEDFDEGDRVRHCSVCGAENFEHHLNEELVCGACAERIESAAEEASAQADVEGYFAGPFVDLDGRY